MVGKTDTPTAAEKARFDIMSGAGCLACMIDGKAGVPSEIHHRVEGCVRLGHMETISLCPYHHRGVLPENCRGSVRLAETRHGPSLATNKPAFERHYGPEEELVMVQNALVRIIQSANRRGEYLSPLRLRRLVEALHQEVVMHMPPSSGRVYAL